MVIAELRHEGFLVRVLHVGGRVRVVVTPEEAPPDDGGGEALPALLEAA